MRTPFGEKVAMKCRRCGKTKSGAWCLEVGEHRGLCCRCFEKKVKANRP